MTSRFAIATDLLADDARGWSNLGDWSHTNDYPTACQALAERVGHAANIAPHKRVLDLGCGAGASLALWRDHFGASEIDAIEAQPSQAARARSQTSGNVRTGKTRELLPRLGTYDAIVSVDAAYHFGPLATLVANLAPHLTPGGSLAFTTLARAHPRLSLLARTALVAASIAPAAVLPIPALTDVLTRAGYRDIALTILDQQVLAGFAAFIARRREALPMRARLSRGWLKIALTAKACRTLRAHYVLVSATR